MIELVAMLLLSLDTGPARRAVEEALDARVAALTRELHAGDSAVRVAAARELGRLGLRARPALQELSCATYDAEDPVRRAAEDAVYKIEHAR